MAAVTDLIVIDGALAATWGLDPGWGAVAFLPATSEVKKIVDPAFDAASRDDVLPLAAAIQWYHYARKPKGHRPRVDVATDSLEIMISAGDPMRGGDGSDWRFMRWFETGYEIRWLYFGTEDHSGGAEVQTELTRFAERCQGALAGRFLRGAPC